VGLRLDANRAGRALGGRMGAGPINQSDICQTDSIPVAAPAIV